MKNKIHSPKYQPNNMTGAELQTLREACHLSRDDLAELVSVEARTLKHWENGRSGVPSDVASAIQKLDDSINTHALQSIAKIQAAHNMESNSQLDILLIRYRSAADLRKHMPHLAHMPAAAHGAIAARICTYLRMTPSLQAVKVHIVWMNVDIYEEWRTAYSLQDSSDTRNAWAAHSLQNQAIPHRADQPPAA